MINKDAKLSLVVGRRGSGKSTLVKKLIKDNRRVIVFDPQDEYRESKGFSVFEGGAALKAGLAGAWHDGFQMAYVPRAGDEAAELHALAFFLLACQARYRQGSDLRQITLVVEEMDLSFPVHQLPADLNGMSRVCNQGRHYGVNVIGVTQFPALVSKRFRGNVADAYIFALSDPDHRVAAAKVIGERLVGRLASLPDHHYLKWTGGAVSEGKN